MLDLELVQIQGNPQRAKKLLRRIAKEFDIPVRNKPTYKHKWLFMWGPGGDTQRVYAKDHKSVGGLIAFFDLGYFGRSSSPSAGSIRLTFNEPHPQRFAHLAPTDIWRYRKEQIVIEDVMDPNGSVVVCGLGRKSRQLYGYRGMEWEHKVVERIRKHYPDREIVYRPKPKHQETIAGTRHGAQGTIRDQLVGASLVVVHHSNVGVDAAILGVPCICCDGIAANFWPNSWGNELVVPSLRAREKFLVQVSWFNWYIQEVSALIKFIEEVESGVDRIAHARNL